MPAGIDPEAFLDAAATAIGLAIAPAHRPGVILNLERIAVLAGTVMSFPLPDEEEPAPVFRP